MLNIDTISTLNLAPIFVCSIIIALAVVYYLLCQEVTKRQQAEGILRQQTERERLVNKIAQHIRKSLDLEEVLATTVAGVQDFLQADRVLIYQIWEDGTGSAITETVLPEYTKILGDTFPEEVFPEEFHQAYSLGKTRAITNVEQADVEPCLADFLKQFGVKAKLVVPILQENREVDRQTPYLWGLLIAHQCSHPRNWESWEVELMKQLATQVAIAIQQSELYKQLQIFNAELELRVQQRTQELAQANTFLRAEIAERQRTEAALQALITASPRAIFTLDLAGNVKIWNPAAERMFGWTEAEVIDSPSPIFLDDQMEEYNTLQQSILQGTTYSRVELQRHKKDGTPINIIFSAAPLSDTENNINGLVAVIADITERKRLDEIRLALEREKELSALKTRFFSMASHEFRTPLSTALAAAQLLEDCRDEWDNSSKRLRNLQRIQGSVKNMVQMLDDILTINRAEAGKLEFNPKQLDLESFCGSFIEELRLSAGEIHKLTFTRQGKAVPGWVDERLLRSILANLLSNAIKYSPDGGNVHLALEFEPDKVILQVQDWGIGIPPTTQKQLFEPFHRGKNVRSISGTGLGLVVVKKCVDLHQGTINITSEVGVGTACVVTLPLQ
ncbi:MAG: GAF domain-containing protein [Calothrix sp. CSU_2_0]|nr:GAF domain-containing protein [Calothrix sp. CSU_2_0]